MKTAAGIQTDKRSQEPDLTASAAGAMAACAVTFKGGDERVALCAEYRALALDMTFANQDALNNGITYDGKSQRRDKISIVQWDNHQIFWAATMLFKATGDLKYRDEALFYAMARM
jgi:hypothetical protein